MEISIPITKSSKEYKRGFKGATQMILQWCKDSKTKKITDLIAMIEASNKLQELLEGEE